MFVLGSMSAREDTVGDGDGGDGEDSRSEDGECGVPELVVGSVESMSTVGLCDGFWPLGRECSTRL